MLTPILTVNAPAKINWSLYVLGRRDDGYHTILSLMQRIGLYDTLTFESSRRLELHSDMDLPPGQNLVFRAAEMLREHAGTREGARITLRKEIPSGAGLGGGSSDAASALMGLNMLWGLGLGRNELKELGGRLGSDIPFFLEEEPLAVVEGRGEILSPLSLAASHTVLVVHPALPVSTAWAYGTLDAAVHFSSSGSSRELTKTDNCMNNIKFIFEALATGSLHCLASLAHNDFEEVVSAEYPVIGALKLRMREQGAALALMSGSGSAVFGLFEDRERALSASRSFLPFFSRVVETLPASPGREGSPAVLP
ncbi:MAG: 4-(cytidine 5'-diphospho)-2-C-methyl-D-erythritol kinase [Nitrospirales bacterium]|nr:4-(cytidine 5'-diphospho)-2-C-methyl-D-erythritol kinase [Nitrospirales bacterium]